MIGRRRFWQFYCGCRDSPGGIENRHEPGYPARPIRLVVGFPPGGPNDTLGRLIAQWLTQKLGQPINVENKGGKSGNIATEEVVRAPADGYTLLLCGPANAISGSLYPNLQFNFLRDIVPVAGVTREALVMVVHPSVPAKTVPEFLAHAKANAGGRQDGVDRESAARRMSPANCSSRWRGLRLPSCITAAAGRR